MPRTLGTLAERGTIVRRALTLAFLLATTSVGPGAGAATAQELPPSLQGEYFMAHESSYLGTVRSDIGDVDITGSCTPSVGETFTISYVAEGFAFGPYPGTFTESGTVTVTLTALGADSGIAVGLVTDWTVKFTIDSVIGQVSGKKTISDVYVTASCSRTQGIFFPPAAFYDLEQARGTLDYEATIRTATGTFTDQGRAYASVSHVCVALERPTCDLYESESFLEYFYLSTGVLPLDTTGKATGGGQIGDIGSVAQVSFGFEVKKTEDPDRLHGRCLVNDPAEETRVKCLTVTSYQQVGNTATWEGTAEVNGVGEDYRITVQDNGEPNQGIDTFSIATETYEAGGNVQHGNVQLHKQELTP
ncbi:MAG: hypothetical protein M3N29_01970 [Chloroflexota bacterium]|nr:hypothetical protein [Chloroflexota bacterium]